MRKLCFLLALICSIAAAFADNDPSSSVSELIKKDLFKNQREILEISQGLTQDEKAALYTEYQKNPAVPVFVNFIIGFGIGSFIEGDAAGGAIALACDLGGSISFLTGAILTLSDSVDLANLGVGLGLFGFATIIGSRIYEISRPFAYANRYNDVLKKSLNNFELSINLSAERNFAGLSLSYTKNLN